VQTVVETPSWLKAATELFSEVERDRIVAMVAANPECGDLIQGTGGFRKVRVARRGMGKRGGARVIYIFRNQKFPVFLITAYAENQKDNLTKRNGMSYRGAQTKSLPDMGKHDEQHV
jgi:hypothetical protein